MGIRSRVLYTVAAFAALPVALSGQTGTSGWTPPRTPDGQPDLQGVWLSKSATPLERPQGLEGRTSLSEAEVADLKARAARLFKDVNSDFAAGDNFFLAAWANPDRFKSPTSTHGSEEMIEREFDGRTSLIVAPTNGRVPALTTEGRARREAIAATARRADAAEGLDLAHRCLSWGVPRLGGRYGAGDLGYYQILQSPGYVVLFMETGHEARIIPIDGRPHLPASIRQWSGDSRGRWEGSTLVIETTNFSHKSNFMGSAAGLHLVERLTRVAPDTIRYEMALTDSTTWTEPWAAEMPLKQSSELLYESACHEGNYHILTGILSAARAQEKADVGTGSVVAQDSSAKAARAAVDAWLSLTDGQRYDESWDAAAKLFKEAITREKWSDALRGVRAPLGQVKSRAFKSATPATSPPGAPQGEYFLFQFDTNFDQRSAAAETVTMFKEADGTWRAAGYFIK